MEKVPMTKGGFAALETELKNLKSVERPAVIEAIAEARGHGDLSENAEYHAAREKQSFIEGRIQELESVISLAQVIDPTSLSGETVKFGATVTIADEEDDNEMKIHIVGAYESNADHGRISVTAPLAKGLIGKAIGDSAEVRTPSGVKRYEIVEIEYAEIIYIGKAS